MNFFLKNFKCSSTKNWFFRPSKPATDSRISPTIEISRLEQLKLIIYVYFDLQKCKTTVKSVDQCKSFKNRHIFARLNFWNIFSQHGPTCRTDTLPVECCHHHGDTRIHQHSHCQVRWLFKIISTFVTCLSG